MLAEDALLIERPTDGVLVLQLNRPEKFNALATPFLQRIADVLTEADADVSVRVAILTGSEKCFAAGADIGELQRSDDTDPIEGPRFQACRSIRAFAKPLLCAVEGFCLGAGAELMLCGDIVIAGDGARIGQPETNLGIIPGAGGTAILPRLVGRSLAMKMVLTGEAIDAEQAMRTGLVADVVAKGSALPASLELATKLAGRAQDALQAAKASILDYEKLDLNAHLLAERHRFVVLLGSADKAEGVTAFLQKRKPVWSGS
ncbi:Enoyl-CoA hydratase/isomerase [Novosphingobium pentaromativorans US6-1]|uniref:Enoyl-CoA hydratase/isomerase n=1 Tax=Novosphingobium pentaromativorans US6-1 TaxID=1088721 RepID=G6EHH7_9SPHN|nr:Enoyl-CoA hydratase/isomerase [Novosphingobium pentaromativorans US6-1]